MANVGKVLVSEEQIHQRVQSLAAELQTVFRVDELVVMPVLTGALMFTADLLRRISLPVRIEPVSVESYPGQNVRSQGCRFRLEPAGQLAGRNVLIVDDIYDSGQTLAALIDACQQRGVASVRSCVLLRKKRDDLPDRPGQTDFVGFEIPDEFVVGYGLDFDGYYRNLPFIGVLAEHARGGAS